MPATAQSLINQAYALGYDALSDRDLKEAMLATAAPGGGGLSGADAQTLIDIACSMAAGALSMRDTLVCIAGLFGANSGGVTAQQAVVLAAANKYAALSDHQLDESLLAVLS